jgi:hypothetical protein
LSQTHPACNQVRAVATEEGGLDGNLPAEPADDFADNQVTPGADNAACDLPADLR